MSRNRCAHVWSVPARLPLGGRRLYFSARMTTTRASWDDRQAPTLDDLEQLAREAFAALPESFRALAGEVTFAVAEFPDEDVVGEMELESPFDILGLFHGVGLAHASATPPTGVMPNRIWLYRRPILDYWAEHEET